MLHNPLHYFKFFLLMSPHCQQIMFDPEGHTLAVTLFLGALVGSLTHCAGMCGPFVLAQAAQFKIPEGRSGSWYRQLLLPYHLGRLTTYTALGITATFISANILHIAVFQIASSLLLVIAGALFLAAAFSQIIPTKYFNINFNLCGTPSWIMQRIVPLLPSGSLVSGYVLGILLGFLPCGLVYAAIIAAAATGNVAEAAVSMIAFAAGTMPLLMAIGSGATLLLNRRHAWLKPAAAVVMAFNSIVLFAMAGKGFV